VRAVFFLLLFANLAYLAWAEWIDVPERAPANAAYAKLPRLKLITEQSTEVNSSGNASKTALTQPPPQSRCRSIGPFADPTSAATGVSQLREKGLTPRQRSVEGEISKGFWVYIGGLKDDRDVAQVLRTLEQSHVEDAHLMPDAGDAHRVSVGLFSDRTRADRRAQSLQKLGLQPEVAERKAPGTSFWVDVDLPPGTPDPTAQDFSGAHPSSPVTVAPCHGESSHPAAAPLTPAPANPSFRAKIAGASGVS